MINRTTSNDAPIGRLPRAFIGVAFLHFVVGASLGGWMAVSPASWNTISSVHGELNPFGWLTMLIYGMTYAVLSISAGLRPPKPWVGWLQFAFAEIGILFVSLAYGLNMDGLLRVGLGLQFAAPVLFLVNILSAVFDAKKKREVQFDGMSLLMTNPPQDDSPLSFLQRKASYQAIDRVARRGTDIPLMFFLVATGWIFIASLFAPRPVVLWDPPQGATWLIYYGWIAGTVFSVGFHLFPRFVGKANVSPKSITIGQILWGVSLVLGTACTFAGEAGYIAQNGLGIAHRFMGIAIAWYASIFLVRLCPGSDHPTASDNPVYVPRSSRTAWVGCWLFCLCLGVSLILGLNPFSLSALHLLFLGFTTNLIYGIGYTLFPLFLRKKRPSEFYALPQVWISLVGSLLMVIAFWRMQSSHLQGSLALLGIGGTFAFVGAILFLVQWPLLRRQL